MNLKNAFIFINVICTMKGRNIKIYVSDYLIYFRIQEFRINIHL